MQALGIAGSNPILICAADSWKQKSNNSKRMQKLWLHDTVADAKIACASNGCKNHRLYTVTLK